MENIVILLGLFVIFFLVVGVVGLILYAVLFFIQKNLESHQPIFTKKRLTIISLSFTVFCAGYLAFTAVYPNDDFYFAEFETLTFRKIPDSAKVLTKSASYADFHGDYTSNATIKRSKNDYQQLPQEIQQDTHFEKLSDEKELIEFQQIMSDREDRLYYIGFHPDGKTIGIYLINS